MPTAITTTSRRWAFRTSRFHAGFADTKARQRERQRQNLLLLIENAPPGQPGNFVRVLHEMTKLWQAEGQWRRSPARMPKRPDGSLWAERGIPEA